MFPTLRGGIQSLSARPGGGIQSLSPRTGGPRSAGIQSASDRGGPGNLPGNPGPTGLGPKPSSIGAGAIALIPSSLQTSEKVLVQDAERRLEGHVV